MELMCWLAGPQRCGRKPPAACQLSRASTSSVIRDLVGVDPLSDVGVRPTSDEVDETEQLVERRAGSVNDHRDAGARRERAARWGYPPMGITTCLRRL